MRYLMLLPLLALCGCGNTYLRREPGSTTPSIHVCTSQEQLDAHISPDKVAAATAAGGYNRGVYVIPENSIYLLVADADSLSVDESLTLTHELQHCADIRFHGNMWALLKAMNHNEHTMGRESK